MPSELKFAPEPSAPALPNFPEKLKPSPTSLARISPAAQTPLKMGFAVASPAATEQKAPSSILHPPSSPELVPQSVIRNPQSPTPLLNVPLRLVGVVGKLYVLLESDRGLVLLDQHAAHERILYEQMLNRLEQNGSPPSQKLLLPETIELPPRDAQFLREQLAALTRLGVGLSEFGERTFLLDALPPFVKVPDTRRFVFDLVDEARRRPRGESRAARRTYRGQDRLPPRGEGQRPPRRRGTGKSDRGFAPLRDALHLPARPPDAD